MTKGYGTAEAKPGTATIVDLSGAEPVVKELILNVLPAFLSFDGRSALGRDTDGNLVPLTLR